MQKYPILIYRNSDFIRSIIEERINVKKSNKPDKDQIQLTLLPGFNFTNR